ncbi:MAG: DUF6036 family nucleotidyltransferase [Elusimicrobiota bacterium]
MANDKQFENDYIDFIKLLNKYDVKYLVIGAYAVMYHTKIARETKEIDFWIEKSSKNAERCAKAIKEFAGGIRINPEDLLGQKEIFFIGVEPHRIDIFNNQGKMAFNEAYKNKVDAMFRDVKTYFVAKTDLLALKRYFYRKADVKDLKRLSK